MSTPGVSLFQGIESIKINSDVDIDEEEELDQRRRNEEIGNLLQNAFDDLEDEDTTVDSTTHQSDLFDDKAGTNHYPKNNFQYNGTKSDMNQLKIVLESQNIELDNIKKKVLEETSKTEELQKRLLLAEAELERALAAKSNTHELLVESKEKCSNLENTISKLKIEKKGLEDENKTLFGKLEASQTILADMQRKYDMVERDLTRSNDRNAEYKRKQMENRHRAEIDVFRQQIEQLDEKLRMRSHEFDTLNSRYLALQNTHDMMLIDKGSKINDLNNALSEAQNKCEELLEKENYYHENIHLQKLVTSLKQQLHCKEHEICTLNERLEHTTAEIDIMDNMLHQYNVEETPGRITALYSQAVESTRITAEDKIFKLKDELLRSLENIKAKREEMKTLKKTVDEKNAEINNLKSEEIKSLVQITTLKEEKIRLENRIKFLEIDLQDVSEKLKKEDQNLSKIQSLNNELELLKEDKVTLENKHENMDKQLKDAETNVRILNRQINDLQTELDELKKEYESMKINYVENLEGNDHKNRDDIQNLRLDLEKQKMALKDSQLECDRLKNLYIEISNEKEDLTFEIENLKKVELQKAYENISRLQHALSLSETKCSEMAQLLEHENLNCHKNVLEENSEHAKKNQYEKTKNSEKSCSLCLENSVELTKNENLNLSMVNLNSMKENQIEELNRELEASNELVRNLKDKLKLTEEQEHLINELKSKASEFEEYIKFHTPSLIHNIPTSKCIATETPLLQNEISKIEKRIRDEMAKIFASQLKIYQLKLKDADDKNECLQHEYQLVLNEMHQREKEVDFLKEAILAERERLQEIIKEKEDEHEAKLKLMNKTLKKIRDELRMKDIKVDSLKKDIEERQKQIEAERRSMKAVMAQWDEQRKSVDQVELEWREKLEDVKKTHEVAKLSWQTKYNSAKLTARNYKRYADDKEAHMLKEYNRIKQEYNANLTKLEARLHEELSKKDIELKKRVAAIEKKRLRLDEIKENKENQMHN